MTKNDLWFWLLLLGSTAFEVAGDVLFKYGRFISGITFYTVGTLGWAYSLKFESLSRAIVIFTVANMLAAVVAGHYFFAERMSTREWIGVALAVGAIVALEA